MPQGHTKPIAQAQWDKVKEPLYQYWMIDKKPLKSRSGHRNGIVNLMDDRHQFSATANQYSAQFKKKWRWDRNQQCEDWRAVAYAIHQCIRDKQGWEVFKDGILYDSNKVISKISSWKTEVSYSKPMLKLPQNLTVRPKCSTQGPTLTNLPFRLLESRWSAQLCQTKSGRAVPGATGDGQVGFPTSNNGDQVLAIALNENKSSFSIDHEDAFSDGKMLSYKGKINSLDSVVPEFLSEAQISNPSHRKLDTSAMTSIFYRRVLYSIANNFAGLEKVSRAKILDYLQAQTDQQLYQFLGSAEGHSAPAIAQNLFKGAIEAGYSNIIYWVLNSRHATLDVNKIVIIAENRRWTPIERAVYLRHAKVAEILLKHHADTNLSHEPSTIENSGALGYSLYTDGYVSGEYRLHPDLGLFHMMLEAGGIASPQQCYAILSSCRTDHIDPSTTSDITHSMMMKFARTDVSAWYNIGIFHEMAWVLDEQRSLKIVKLLCGSNVDLNAHYHRPKESFGDSWHIIDIASKRGHLQLVHRLRDVGAMLTHDTLACAIAGGNHDLIHSLLLDMNANVCSLGQHGSTPLAAAIRLQDSLIIELIEKRGALEGLDRPGHAQSALDAASEVGNISFVEFLIHSGASFRPKNLGRALAIAIKNDEEDVARMLIDIGADSNCSPSSLSDPLPETLRQRQSPGLVQALLAANANPNGKFGNNLESAIKWGNLLVIKSLIEAGANLNAMQSLLRVPLTVAAQCQREDIVSILVESGASLKDSDSDHGKFSALHAAVKNEDLSMVRKLLNLGADPNDENAVKAASQLADSTILDLIIAKYLEKYTRHCVEVGSTLLNLSIDQRDERKLSNLLQRGANATAVRHSWRKGTVSSLGYAIIKDKEQLPRMVNLFFSTNSNDPNSIVFRKCNFKTRSYTAMTALLLAIEIQDLTTISSLISHGADVNLTTRGPIKRRPLQQAAEIGNMQIVDLLIRYGAEVDAPAADRDGGTALQLAATGGYLRIVQTLLKHGADVSAPGSKADGLSALECAAENGRLDVVQYLLNAEAKSKITRLNQIRMSITLAKRNSHFSISDLLSEQIDAQNLKDIPEPPGPEPIDFAIHDAGESPEQPKGNVSDCSAIFNFASPMDISSPLGFSDFRDFGAPVPIDDAVPQNQSLILGSDTSQMMSSGLDDSYFDEQWSLTVNN